ncbi:cysteine rich repeat-containing protein [Zavarzinia compransoris]|uniref:Cysteine rich repeat protein n=1 Tax=Zavarzinia compransoris TaxID=1264899 RepID=A0A317DWV3_9PROT|nr:cysteine rich repeat-containing protein [Zavarzinia compransoris]PWR18834.1 hypothetical protein DKG75_17810 [Zavarzinia compransoris]TDP48824.1 cysteine rich repeat protein [Zavarzinia compransoris]
MSPFPTLALAAALAAGLAAPALAQGGPAAQKLRAACAKDIETLCPGVQPGGGRILQCLKQHRKEVSADCTAAFEEARAARKAP